MPARQISPQSFDDILSELGNDPAIPDPHGIRKSSPPPRVDNPSQSSAPKPIFSAKNFELKNLNFNLIGIFCNILILCGGGYFFYFFPDKSGAELEIDTLHSEISALKDEFEFSQSEWMAERDDLYEALDLIEVSIHSIKVQTPTKIPQSKPALTPHEAELRRWRYLGLTRMGVTEHAFFHTGKSTLMVNKDGLVLGEWRLSQAEKEVATLTHVKGKSITFKSTQAE